MQIKITIAQLLVTDDIGSNLKKIINVLSTAKDNEWIIFPEGMLSGYFPENSNFLSSINWHQIDESIKLLRQLVAKINCHCIVGSVLREFKNDKIYFKNSALILNNSIIRTYHKCNLSMLDRQIFSQGNEISAMDDGDFKYGVQMCRELAFPEQWKLLKHQQAKIIFHINNSIQSFDAVRKHVLISRAFENQLFVCSVNNGAPSQVLPSLIIDPQGQVIYESSVGKEEICSKVIDLNSIQNNFISQERTDLIGLVTS